MPFIWRTGVEISLGQCTCGSHKTAQRAEDQNLSTEDTEDERTSDHQGDQDEAKIERLINCAENRISVEAYGENSHRSGQASGHEQASFPGRIQGLNTFAGLLKRPAYEILILQTEAAALFYKGMLCDQSSLLVENQEADVEVRTYGMSGMIFEDPGGQAGKQDTGDLSVLHYWHGAEKRESAGFLLHGKVTQEELLLDQRLRDVS